MKGLYNDDEARAQTLDELLQKMHGMDARRIPGMPREEPALTIAIMPGRGSSEPDGDEEPDENEGPEPDEQAMAGMDPRLADIIRKRKGGAL